MKRIKLMLFGEEVETPNGIEQSVTYVTAERAEGEIYRIDSIPESSQVNGYNLNDIVKVRFDSSHDSFELQKILLKSKDKLIRTFDPLEPKFIKKLKQSGCTVKGSIPATIHIPAKIYPAVEANFDSSGYLYELVA